MKKTQRTSIFNYISDTEKDAETNKFCNRADLTNEASVEDFFVFRLLKDLGYLDAEIMPKKSLDELTISAGGRKKEKYKPDYCIVSAGFPRWLLDAKEPSEDVDAWTYQCAGYSLAINRQYKGDKPLRYYAITNGLVFKLFQWDEDEPVLSMRFHEFVDEDGKYEELKSMLSPDIARSGWKTTPSAYLDTITLHKPSITEVKRLFNQCHQIIWKSEKMSPQAAFFEFVKLMFVKLWEDRKLLEDPELGPSIRGGKPIPKSRIKFSKQWIDAHEIDTEDPVDVLLFQPLILNLHEAVVKGEKKPIFEEHERINLQPGTIKQVVTRMEGYNLFGIDEDLNGRLFETFLSATMRGKALGQFFTPRTIVKLMVKIAKLEASRNKLEKVLDGCCGTGGFLIEALTDMRDQLRSNTSLSEAERGNLLKQLANDTIFGIDAGREPPIARIARINMYLHGDGGSRIYMTDALDKMVSIQSLDGVQAKREMEELHDLLVKSSTKFEVVLTNPPFAMDYSENLPMEKQILDHYELIKYGYEDTGKKRPSLRSTLMYLERYNDLLEDGGRLITVIDDSILSGKRYKFARDYLRERFIVRAVISLHGDAFYRAGARAKTSILYLIRRQNGDTSQPDVFMAESLYIGRDDVPVKTSPSKAEEAKRNAEQEIDQLTRDFNKYLNGGNGPWLVPAARITDRLDVKSCLPRSVDIEKKWMDQGIETIPFENIVDIVKSAVSTKENPHELFNLVVVTYDGIAEETPENKRLGKEITYSQLYRVEANDLVISNINAVQGATGIILPGMAHVVVSPEFTILRVKDRRFNPFYLWNYLRSPEVRARLLSRSTGVGRHRITWEEDLRSLPVPYLSEEKQERITQLSLGLINGLKQVAEGRWETENILNEALNLENEWAVNRLKAAKPPR